ncbi:MAG TPA: hypothetical protein VKK61_02375 [Tepidisphaeraceae bacterium]|nr:hypothetical protein [Tepidisphaeraceae bacterium]
MDAHELLEHELRNEANLLNLAMQLLTKNYVRPDDALRIIESAADGCIAAIDRFDATESMNGKWAR